MRKGLAWFSAKSGVLVQGSTSSCTVKLNTKISSNNASLIKNRSTRMDPWELLLSMGLNSKSCPFFSITVDGIGKERENPPFIKPDDACWYPDTFFNSVFLGTFTWFLSAPDLESRVEMRFSFFTNVSLTLTSELTGGDGFNSISLKRSGPIMTFVFASSFERCDEAWEL